MRTIPILALALLVAGCEWVNPMMQQPKVKPYRESVFFPDQVAMRHPPAGTRPAGAPVEPAVVSGRNPDGTPVARIPVPVTPELLEVGRRRFDVFCAVCHGVLGDGQGPVARNMSIRPPPSLLGSTQRPDGFFYGAITEGYGYMPSYRPWLDDGERWAVVAYVRALQLSQATRIEQAPPDVRARLEKETR
ncbi:MAG TPA: cytochrome c [Anaeromyxobacteraceae bacterium]|nr:cytochrome c [Anaeromyxobacteraceae bacterium]